MFMIPMFSSVLLLAFVYKIIILSYDHTQNRHTRGGGGERGGDK